MGHRKTSVEIDEALLERAGEILSTSTVKATVDEALREVVRLEARRQEVRALAAMEGMDLAEPRVMSDAWRR